MQAFHQLNPIGKSATLGGGFLLALLLGLAPLAWADTPPANTGVNVNTGLASNAILGSSNQSATNTGVAVNGAVNPGANLNNQQTDVRNLVQPVLMSTPSGGNSAIVLPRNPLPMPNANLGRSNFGFQAGVQNNPGFGTLSGNSNALGWFAQMGVTVPFGKIPDIYNSPKSNALDDIRREQEAERRQVFGDIAPKSNSPSNTVNSSVQGRVVRLGAFNYTTATAGKIDPQVPVLQQPNAVPNPMPQPKVLALAPADVFSHPLNAGEKIGVVEVGKEYPYLGHTHSGWVKVLLPNGAEGWSSSHFEYIKYDFTEIDNLVMDSTANVRKSAEKQTLRKQPKS